MPTSSQAMILRGTERESSPRALLNVHFASPVDFQSDCDPPRSEKERCELVQFDFSVSATPDHSMKGFEGVFAFDPQTQSYRWQIYSMAHKEHESRPPSADKNRGDHVGEPEVGNNLEESESFIQRQPSDCTRHFTTPAVSVIDNTETEGPAVFPPEMKRIDDTTYRRLEELGFRRRTTYSPSGAIIRLKPGSVSPIRSPQRCTSEPQATTECISKLTINNLDADTMPKPNTVSYDKRRRFPNKPLITGTSMRRRVPATKHKSLLEEVKESVNWSNRVTPTSHPRPVSARVRYNVVCFSLRDCHEYSHKQIKDLVEMQIQCQVKNLQYDPVSMRTAEIDVLDRWLVTFNSQAHCQKAIERGLTVGGDRVIIRAWEDIVYEESLYDDSDNNWGYPCSYRLQSDKHNRALMKFLQVH